MLSDIGTARLLVVAVIALIAGFTWTIGSHIAGWLISKL